VYFSGLETLLKRAMLTPILEVEILVNDQGHRITPSYVAFTDDERLVGDAAKNQAAANPKRTIFDVK
jgi:heat shock protein 5